MITIYFKTNSIIIKFLEQCILPRIMPVSKCIFVVSINFVRHHTIVVCEGKKREEKEEEEEEKEKKKKKKKKKKEGGAVI